MVRETPTELTVRNVAGQWEMIPRLEVYEAQCTLGVQLAPMGTQKMNSVFAIGGKGVESLKGKLHLMHHEAIFSLWSSILQKLSYP